MDRQYWLMLHKSMTDANLDAFPKAVHGSIFELSMDGVVTLWPVDPHSQPPGTHELCEVCLRYLNSDEDPSSASFSSGCLAGREEGTPCAFEPAPEAEAHQDFDNLLLDGCPILEDVRYTTPSQFLRAHSIDPADFLAMSLGIHSSIRTCRDFFVFCCE